MAVAFSGISAYTDDHSHALDFWTRAVAGNDVIPWIQKYGQIIYTKADAVDLPRMESVVTIQDGNTCISDFDNDNDTTIKKSTITLKKGFVGDTICIHDLEDYFTSIGLQRGQHYMENGMGAMGAGIILNVQQQIGKAIGNEIVNGGSNWITSGILDLIYAVNTGTAPNNINVGTSTITSGGSAGTDAAGCFNVVQSLIDAAMADKDLAADLLAGNMVIAMSPKEYSLYYQNYVKLRGTHLITPGLANLAGGLGEIQHPGYPVTITTLAHLTGSSTVFLTRKGNITFAMDLPEDFTRFDIGMDQYNENLWWKARFKGGVGFRQLDQYNLLYWGPLS